MTIEIADLSCIDQAADAFVAAMGENRVWAFHGEMGAGKTTLINAICRRLGAKPDDTASPTFAIINEYPTASGVPIYHFDFYRIDTPEQALDLGLDDYFYSGAPCFMEWPENVAEFLPDFTVNVDIKVNSDDHRTVSF